VNTVRTHVRSIYRKLEVGTKTGAVRVALRRGLITLA
jgi:DNA-binding CsgD family transcriptional regulator